MLENIMLGLKILVRTNTLRTNTLAYFGGGLMMRKKGFVVLDLHYKTLRFGNLHKMDVLHSKLAPF
jgi:hypothetical protein